MFGCKGFWSNKCHLITESKYTYWYWLAYVHVFFSKTRYVIKKLSATLNEYTFYPNSSKMFEDI